jgi:hypothetical protein
VGTAEAGAGTLTKVQIAALILKEVAKHVLRRWYIYTTFLVLALAPFSVALAVSLGWLGYFSYLVLTQPKEKDTLRHA